MRTALLLVVALALVLSVSAVWADPSAGWGYDDTNSSSATGAYTATGYIYRYPGYTWEMGVDDPVNGGGFAVTADIEMWMSMNFAATEIYFHIGEDPGPSPEFNRDVNGWLSSNNGQYLFVTKEDQQPPQATITQLDFQHNIFGGSTPANCPPIPVEWWLSDSGAMRQGTYSTGGNNNQLWGVTWLIDNGTAGYHPFTIRCKIKPDRYQPDGYYEMDPVLVVSPEL
jgi:hypothetical protein